LFRDLERVVDFNTWATNRALQLAITAAATLRAQELAALVHALGNACSKSCPSRMQTMMMAKNEEYQSCVASWVDACFGPDVAGDKHECSLRFVEEALELAQACHLTKDEAHSLVERVYGRPKGVRAQEVGGVMVTLAALCSAQGIDLAESAEAELARLWMKIQEIRAMNATNPKFANLHLCYISGAQQAVTSERHTESQ